MKLADITPVHKKDDVTIKSNYSPISGLPAGSKIFERIIQRQIALHMETFLSPYLCGYRKGFSVQHALIALIEKLRLSLDNKGYGGEILMDLSKAFDTLNHDLLIAKVHAYGFSKKALILVKSYLSNRWQRTKINKIKLLGVTIDRELKFKKHVQSIYSKAGKKLNAFAFVYLSINVKFS